MLAVMRLEPAEARRRFAAAPVLRLATADIESQPHVVPCTFVVDGDCQVVIGIDSKPKASSNLRRLRNIAANPRVSMIVDHYTDDWTRLWWARADGLATVEQAGASYAAHWDLLRAKYPQYVGQVLDGPIIVVAVESWSGWAFAPG
jgi:PPOX class probable F420-dependent enzyme